MSEYAVITQMALELYEDEAFDRDGYAAHVFKMSLPENLRRVGALVTRWSKQVIPDFNPERLHGEPYVMMACRVSAEVEDVD